MSLIECWLCDESQKGNPLKLTALKAGSLQNPRTFFKLLSQPGQLLLQLLRSGELEMDIVPGGLDSTSPAFADHSQICPLPGVDVLYNICDGAPVEVVHPRETDSRD